MKNKFLLIMLIVMMGVFGTARAAEIPATLQEVDWMDYKIFTGEDNKKAYVGSSAFDEKKHIDGHVRDYNITGVPPSIDRGDGFKVTCRICSEAVGIAGKLSYAYRSEDIKVTLEKHEGYNKKPCLNTNQFINIKTSLGYKGIGKFFVHPDLIEYMKANHRGCRMLFSEEGPELHVIVFNPAKIDLYKDTDKDENGKNAAMAEPYGGTNKARILAYYNDAEVKNQKDKQKDIQPNTGETLPEDLYFVCEKHKGCGYSGCDRVKASNNYFRTSWHAVDYRLLSEGCVDHACGFIWVVNNTVLDDGERPSDGDKFKTGKEAVDCTALRLSPVAYPGAQFCKEHTCNMDSESLYRCLKAKVGVNTINAYEGIVTSSEEFSDYCRNHFCQSKDCKNPSSRNRYTVSPDVIKNGSGDSIYINFPGYCTEHDDYCEGCGGEIKVVDYNADTLRDKLCGNCLTNGVPEGGWNGETESDKEDNGTCIVEGCTNLVMVGLDYCRRHYEENAGVVDEETTDTESDKKTCISEGCTNPVVGVLDYCKECAKENAGVGDGDSSEINNGGTPDNKYGSCIICWERDAVPGGNFCEDCLESENAAAGQGYCIWCGIRKQYGSEQLCLDCINKAQVKKCKNHSDKVAVKDGLCQDCIEDKGEDKVKKCKYHEDRYAVEDGLCDECLAIRNFMDAYDDVPILGDYEPEDIEDALAGGELELNKCPKHNTAIYNDGKCMICYAEGIAGNNDNNNEGTGSGGNDWNNITDPGWNGAGSVIGGTGTVNPSICSHNPVTNTVTFSNITATTHVQTWNCNLCGSQPSYTYEHMYINGVCVCGKTQSSDKELPTVEIISPVDITNIEPKTAIHLRFSDNEGLASVKYKVLWKEYEDSQVRPLSGKTQELFIDVLPDKAGTYTLLIEELKDIAGNKVEKNFIFEIKNGEGSIENEPVNKEAPVVEICNDLSTLKKGDIIRLRATDNSGLDFSKHSISVAGIRILESVETDFEGEISKELDFVEVQDDLEVWWYVVDKDGNATSPIPYIKIDIVDGVVKILDVQNISNIKNNGCVAPGVGSADGSIPGAGNTSPDVEMDSKIQITLLNDPSIQIKEDSVVRVSLPENEEVIRIQITAENQLCHMFFYKTLNDLSDIYPTKIDFPAGVKSYELEIPVEKGLETSVFRILEVGDRVAEVSENLFTDVMFIFDHTNSNLGQNNPELGADTNPSEPEVYIVEPYTKLNSNSVVNVPVGKDGKVKFRFLDDDGICHIFYEELWMNGVNTTELKFDGRDSRLEVFPQTFELELQLPADRNTGVIVLNKVADRYDLNEVENIMVVLERTPDNV